MIDAAPLHALMDLFIARGGTPDGGMRRLTLSRQDGAARDQLAQELGADLLASVLWRLCRDGLAMIGRHG